MTAGLYPDELSSILSQIEQARIASGLTQLQAHERTLTEAGRDGVANRSWWPGVVGGSRQVSLEMLRAMASAVGLEIEIVIREVENGDV